MPLTPSLPLPLTTPFFLHSLIEIPASINFFFNPTSQLFSPAPQAHAIIRQYATLLCASSFISLIFALRDIDSTSRKVAGALAVYHLAPLIRAGARIMRGERMFGGGGKRLGGPGIHFVVHGVCFVGLAGLYFNAK